MAARKAAAPPPATRKRAAPSKPAATAKKASTARKTPPKATPAKPARKRAPKAAPKIAIEAPIGVLAAVEAYIAQSEISGQARVKAEIARTLAAKLDAADPPTAPALARELQAALIGILPKDAEQHDDWTTRLGASTNRDTTGS